MGLIVFFWFYLDQFAALVISSLLVPFSLGLMMSDWHLVQMLVISIFTIPGLIKHRKRILNAIFGIFGLGMFPFLIYIYIFITGW